MFVQIHLGVNSVSGDKNIFLFLVREKDALLLGRKEEGREPFLDLLFLSCPHLKIINVPAMVCMLVSPQVHMLKSNPQCEGIRRWGLGGSLGHEGWLL